LGVLRILIEKRFPIDLERAFEKALSLQPISLEESHRAKILRSLHDFLWARAQSFLEAMGYKTDEIRSVRVGSLSDFSHTLKRLAAVHALRKNADFELLAVAFKRAANILRQAGFPADAPHCERGLLREAAELSLYDALTRLEGQVSEKLSSDNFEEGLKNLVSIKPHLDCFFEDVMVMAEDQNLRCQRLALLSRLVRLFLHFADLSELQASA
jgi:glycyl-tRNA synthetase beta chain